jgi:hypothetical protein
MEKPSARGDFRSPFWIGMSCIAVSCLVSRLCFLRVDRMSQTIRRWSASIFGIRRSTVQFQSIEAAEFVQRRYLPPVIAEQIVLRTGDNRRLTFGGSDWVNTEPARRQHWFAAIRELLRPESPKASEQMEAIAEPALRFSLRRVLIAVILAATVLGMSGWAKMPLQMRLVLAVLVAGCCLLLTTRSRWHALGLVVAGQYLPYFWMIRVSVPWGHTSGIMSSFANVPAGWFAWILALTGTHPESGWWLCSIAPIQILGAAWLVNRSGGWKIAVVVVSLVLSAAGSLLFYAGYRM